MSDLLLTPTPSGGEISNVDGEPVLTDGLDNAAYLSLFTGAYWGNSIADPDETFDSILESLFDQALTSSLRLDIIAEAERSMAWFVDTGIASDVIVDAEIPSVGVLHLSIRIEQPDGTAEEMIYELNWAAQKVTLT